jgi:hypothetical protein
VISNRHNEIQYTIVCTSQVLIIHLIADNDKVLWAQEMAKADMGLLKCVYLIDVGQVQPASLFVAKKMHPFAFGWALNSV